MPGFGIVCKDVPEKVQLDLHAIEPSAVVRQIEFRRTGRRQCDPSAAAAAAAAAGERRMTERKKCGGTDDAESD